MARSEGLVGRGPEIAALMRGLDEARLGTPGFWLITGEAGIGKTRLLRELGARAGSAGVRVFAGTATETGRNVPFLPLIAPLRRALGSATSASTEPQRTPTAHDPAASTVALAIDGRAVPVEAGSLDTARLFDAIHDVLVRAPTLLAIDDMHWADASSIALLDYLAHRVTDAPLMVVAVARDDPALPALAIADGRRFAPLPLRRLSPDGVRELAHQLAGRSLSAADIEALHRRSAGNPFFVEQLLDGTAGGGRRPDDPVPGQAGERDVPAALRAMLRHRIEHLGPSVAPVIEALAVLGVPAPPELIGQVAEIPVGQTMITLRDATSAGVTIATDEGHGFRHPLYGEVIVADLSGPELRALHARAAAALQGSGDVAAIAEHWWLAGAPEAWASAREAAAAAGRAFAFAEARTHLERAIAAWPAGEPGLVDGLLDAAHAAWITGDPEGAVELAERAAALEPDRPDGALAVATSLWDAGRRSESVIAFERASGLLAGDPSPGRRASGEWAAGRAAVATGRPLEAADHGRRAATLAHDAGMPGVEADGLALAAMSLAFGDRLDGIAWLERAAELALELRAPPSIGHTHQFLVDLLSLAGRIDDSLRIGRQGVAACDRFGTSRTHGSDLRGRVALLLIDRGEWAEADALLARADRRAIPRLAQGILEARRGSFEAAEQLFDDAATAGSIGGPGALGGWLELARTEVTWLRGDVERATAMVNAVPTEPGAWGRDVAAWLARWRARLGHRAPVDASEALATAEAHPDPAAARAIAAELRAWTAPDDPQRVAAWEAAVAAWDDASRPWEAAVAGLDLAAAWFSARDGRRGGAALERARVTAEALGATPLLERIESLARRARVRVGAPRARTEPDAPTSRELDVLHLLAEGRTNPQIAEALFLSPKTVGIHVSRLLDKLGASTRGEAVAVARRRGLID
jgi:DNA-binding CsgD family transcriptional regulator/tetratricopeptide (TPR) repeat protein